MRGSVFRAQRKGLRLSPYLQHTIASPVFFAGVGIHSGEQVRVCVRPAAPGAGIGFFRTDVTDRDPLIAARGDAVCQTRLGTVIGNAAGVTVSTIEHLMAAFAALNIDNAVVELDGPEVPIMDGSSRPFVAILDRGGRRRQEALRRYIEILEPSRSATATSAHRSRPPTDSKSPSRSCSIRRRSAASAWIWSSTRRRFRRELADCRTFGFLHEVEALRAAGLARGGSLDNAVVIDGDKVLNPEGLRRPDEFVRHKALDAIGDLYLLGAPIIGRYEGLYAGHGLNNALVRAVMATPAAWRYGSPRQNLAAAG